MYVVNQFGRVLDLEGPDVEKWVQDGIMRKATDAEVKAHHAIRATMNMRAKAAGTVYFQTVKATPDGYGMSRDHIKNQMANLKIFMTESFEDQKVGLLYNYPYGVISMRSSVRLIYTMFESDRIPEEWIDYLNMADEVLVPSRWCQEVFAKSGIESTVVPLGFNADLFRFIERPLPAALDKPFTFIHYDSFNIRKGFFEVLEAFQKEFGTDENVKLILKTAQASPPIPLNPMEYPNVQVITGSLPENELMQLLATANCMVYPSRGEGFGITPLEAMATGLATIVPNEHGISEYFNSEYMLEVKATERCPAMYRRWQGEDVGKMVVADIEDLRRQMRYAYGHQAEMKELGQKASKYVQQYSYANCAANLAKIITKWQEADVIKRNDSKYLQVERV
jgi:glycosyltransferase involved in cell wall biosynthesis